MNTPTKKHLALSAFLVLGCAVSLNAQRGGHQSGSSVRSVERSGNTGASSRIFSQSPSGSRQGNVFFEHQGRHDAFNRRPATANAPRNFNNNNNIGFSRPPQRFDNGDALNSRPSVGRVFNQLDRSQTQRTVVVNNYRYGPGYHYVPRRYVYAGAPRYSVLPQGFLTVRFGGYPYYYHNGLFFGAYSGWYEPVFAPVGIRVSILPVGYCPISIGPRRYYYYDGVYYRNYNNLDNDYEVVDAPLGAQVSSLPKGATVTTINGEKFYEFNGTYYKEGTDSKNEVLYTVVGKYGHVNNTEVGVSDLQKPALSIGDIIPVLPEGCKEVTINGEQLYVSPDNLYFKPQTVDGNTNYKLVGNGTKQ